MGILPRTEALRYSRAGGGEEKRFHIKHPENEFLGFMKVLFAFLLGMIAVLFDKGQNKSGHAVRCSLPDRCLCLRTYPVSRWWCQR